MNTTKENSNSNEHQIKPRTVLNRVHLPMWVGLVLVQIFLSSLASATPSEVWVKWGAATGGSGTMADPKVVATSTAFDAYMNAQPTDTTIHLLAGTFLTRSATPADEYGQVNSGFIVKAGQKIRGAGMDATVVQIESGSAPGTGLIRNVVFYPDINALQNGAEVSDMTIDCNLQGQPANSCCAAGHLAGSNTRLSRIKVINWGTTFPVGQYLDECFVIGFQYHCLYHFKPGQSQALTNCIIEEVVITQPAAVTHVGGTTAIFFSGVPLPPAESNCGDQYPQNWTSFGAPGPGWFRGATIRNCRIQGVHAGTGTGQPVFFHGMTAGFGTENLRIHDNYAIDVKGTVIYDEAAFFRDMAIENNFFVDVSVGYDLESSGTVNHLRQNMTFRGNYIVLRTDVGGAGFLFSSAEPATNILVANNYIVGGLGSLPSDPTRWGAAAGGGVYNVSFENNTIDVGTADGADINWSLPAATSLAAFSGNHKENGSDVTYLPQPVDGMAETSFTPALNAVGWYRICTGYNYASGRVLLKAPFSAADNSFIDLEFNFDIPYTAEGGTINLIRDLYYGATVTQIRISADPFNNQIGAKPNYLDVYVAQADGVTPIRVRFSDGQLFTRPLAAQFLNPDAPGTESQRVLSIGPGLRTSGSLYAGSANTQLTDDSGKILSSALNVVDVAHGGTGAADSATARANLGFSITGGDLAGSYPNPTLRNAVATSVLGRSGGTAGSPADIQATADGQYLKRAAGALGFATIAASELPSHTHAATDITSGLVATARLGSGSADATKILRGDQAWSTGINALRKTADQTINGTAYQNISDLSFAVAANTDYAFEFTLIFSSTAATGFGFAVNGPASPVFIDYVVDYQTTANATAGTDIITQRHDTAYDAMLATTSTVTGAVNLYAHIKGTLRNGANAGTLSARVRSESANNDLSVKRGSWGTWF